MRERVLSAALAVTLSLAPVLANAECFTETEWRAAHVRILQTDLQVAALECANVPGHSYTDEYATFIHRFTDRLTANAKLLRAHFQRVYGRGSGTALDRFVTKVANDSSGRSMTDMSFCANSAALFKTALAIEKPKLEQAALDYVVDHNEVGQICPVHAVAEKKSKKVASAN